MHKPTKEKRYMYSETWALSTTASLHPGVKGYHKLECNAFGCSALTRAWRYMHVPVVIQEASLCADMNATYEAKIQDDVVIILPLKRHKPEQS